MWWRALYGSDENLDDNHLMRMAGRFSRRLRAWAKENKIPVDVLVRPANASMIGGRNISLRMKPSRDCS